MAQKIIQVVTQMEAGGAQRVALLLHKELLSRGVDAELWFLFQQTPAYATEPGVVSIWPSRPRWFELPSMLMALAGKIRRARPTAMIAHTHYSNLIALPIAACCGVPARLAVHHNAIATYPRAAQLLELWWKRLGCYTQSIAVSEDVRSSLIQWKAALYRDSTRCIYNGLRAGHASESNPADSNMLPEFAGQDILFNVGRLTAQKNQRAIVRVLVEMPGCVAVIAGRGPLEGSLQREACEMGVESRLWLLGEVSSEVVAQWMSHSDVFLFPSKFEAMPMALLEAMQAGMAIVASDIPAHREVAGDCALLSDTAPVPLSTTIRSALLQQKNGNPLGKAARQRSLSFTVQAMATAYLEAL
jgi:glycosyltransferase involved in cell wall biosynthesis